eukprot:sb/3477169/
MAHTPVSALSTVIDNPSRERETKPRALSRYKTRSETYSFSLGTTVGIEDTSHSGRPSHALARGYFVTKYYSLFSFKRPIESSEINISLLIKQLTQLPYHWLHHKRWRLSS